MDIEACFITGVSFGIEIQELEKVYLIIDLGIIRFLFSKYTEEDQ